MTTDETNTDVQLMTLVVVVTTMLAKSQKEKQATHVAFNMNYALQRDSYTKICI